MEKILGLDLGSKTCGIAISDALGMLAHGIETFRFVENKDEKAVEHVKQLVQEHNVKKIVLGLPKHMNGDIGIRGEISIAFKEKLEIALPGIEVILIDERLTTKVAESCLVFADVSRNKRKQVIDKMAAVTILQGYLDSH
ncbi:MAG: Holliday junction resolvase RuvX [Coprobacillaceae bacterium]